MKAKLLSLLFLISFYFYSFDIFSQSNQIYLDGVNDYVEVVNSEINGLNEYTISFWFKYDGPIITDNSQVFVMGQKGLFEVYMSKWTMSGDVPDPVNQTIGAYCYKSDGLKQGSGWRFNPASWTHFTVTVDNNGPGTVFRIFRNGYGTYGSTIESSTTSNSNPFRIGIINGSTSFGKFNGSIDEVKIFDTILTDDQIRGMVYQEIENNNGYVRGTVVPKDIEDLTTKALIPWTNLISYYPMNTMVGNTLIDESGYNNNATLYSIPSFQPQKAPMPYETKADGNWADEATWLHGDVWDIENLENHQAPSQIPDPWSIVQIHHDVTTSNSHASLGLFVDMDKTITVNGDNSITNNWYLQLDGTIDLADDSQLVQTERSDLVTSATGKILRRQEGNSNFYRYNYWTSPVGSLGATSLTDNNGITNNSNNTPFRLNMLKDSVGTPIEFTSAFDEVGKISTEWLYNFQNGITYFDWTEISPGSSIQPGVGYTQKGTGNAGPEQQYIFEGKPNNGTILVSANDVDGDSGNESEKDVTLTTTFIGNPYPCALDAIEFINDNKPGTGNGTISGTILLWEQWAGNSHYLATYEGGYGFINTLTTVRAYQHSDIPIATGTGEGIKLPTNFIPVGQGFFVEVIEDGNIEFNNAQRVFKQEDLGESVFYRTTNTDNNESSTEETAAETQILRLEFGVSSGASRSFVLGFTEDATDGYDYGLDGGLITNPPADDMGSLLNGEQYVIQAFAPYTSDKEIDLVLHASGSYTYSLKATEISNFPESQDLFIVDNLTGQSFNLRSTEDYSFTADAGSYTNRFKVVFQDPSALSTGEFTSDNTLIYVNQTEDKLYVKSLSNQAKQLIVTNMLGQAIKTYNKIDNQALENGISISDLNTGVYIVSVQTENNISIDKKIVIN